MAQSVLCRRCAMSSAARRPSKPSHGGAKTPTRDRGTPGQGARQGARGPAEAPADQPIPAQPGPRQGSRPATMRKLLKPGTATGSRDQVPTENVLREGLAWNGSRIPVEPVLVRGDRRPRSTARSSRPCTTCGRTNLLPHEFVLLAVKDGHTASATTRSRRGPQIAGQFSRVLPLDEDACARSSRPHPLRASAISRTRAGSTRW